MTEWRGPKGSPFAGSWGSVSSVLPGGGVSRSSAAGKALFFQGSAVQRVEPAVTIAAAGVGVMLTLS